jgi:hypothetical protein
MKLSGSNHLTLLNVERNAIINLQLSRYSSIEQGFASFDRDVHHFSI